MTTKLFDRKIHISLSPMLLLIGAAFAPAYLQLLPEMDRRILFATPYIISSVGCFLSVHFHRGRPFTALILLAVFYWCSRSYLGDGVTGLLARSATYAFSIALPVGMIALTMVRERGLFTSTGRMRLVIFVSGVSIIYYVFRFNYGDLLPTLIENYLHSRIMTIFTLPQIPVFINIICIAAITAIAIRRQAPIEMGLVGLLIAEFVALNRLGTQLTSVSFCSAGALIMVLSILRDSYNMAFRDELTGIPSRRALNEMLYGVGKKYAVAMVDVDHFKKFNDTYGHDVGDQVLRMVARRIAEVGGGGKAFRYGGEEFTIIFHDRRADEVLEYLEDLREEIADYPMAIRSETRPSGKKQGKRQRQGKNSGNQVSVTVSMGVAESKEGLVAGSDHQGVGQGPLSRQACRKEPGVNVRVVL